MSPPFSFLLVIFFFFFVVGLGGLFLKTSAFCGNETSGCEDLVFMGSFGYPFSKGVIDSDCGYPGLTFTCFGLDSRPVVNVSNGLYYILSKYESRGLRVVGVDVFDQECPRPIHNFTLPTTSPFSFPSYNTNITYFYNCSSSGYPKHVVQELPCLDIYYNNNTTPGLRSFAFSSFSGDDRFNWYTRNCQESVVVPAYFISKYSDIKKSLKFGFILQWSTPEECMDCEKSGGQCWFNHIYTTTGVHHHACSCEVNRYQRRKLFDKVCPPIQGLSIQLKIILGVCSGIGLLVLVALFICRRRFYLYGSTLSHLNSKIKSSANMEAFLEGCGCHGLQRYKYSQVKKMTNTFKEKLGQGGFGSVFKGKLPDGRLVAVKLLDESKGFCCNGNKRALVYEFMSNGSLEKFIYNRENTSITNPPLGWEKLYQIALGIAKGLEYLHCGCNTRILHFDIKPHNVLLDQDFCPKISDFGLAKLCQTRDSIVSMHIARGTMGYIAPEVTCKSDIYSYGMMILEMIGGRKNIDTTMENISEIYFPKWVYNHFIHDTNIDGHKEIFKEDHIRKMVIVALHSIQTQPVDRPSIRKVVEMLEANVGELQMPPNPFQDPPRFSP